MAAAECVVCAWRANCNKKFQYQSGEVHCPDFTRDLTIRGTGATTEEPEKKK